MSDGPDDGKFWYDKSTSLSPSFAKGHYSRGIIDMLAGRTREARERLATSIALSPMDPMLSLMLTAKALTHVVDGDFAMGRDWALRSVGVNQAHVLVIMTTALACHLAGDAAEAARWTQHLRSLRPEATVTPYLKTLHFADDGFRARVRGVLSGVGIPEG